MAWGDAARGQTTATFTVTKTGTGTASERCDLNGSGLVIIYVDCG